MEGKTSWSRALKAVHKNDSALRRSKRQDDRASMNESFSIYQKARRSHATLTPTECQCAEDHREYFAYGLNCEEGDAREVDDETWDGGRIRLRTVNSVTVSSDTTDVLGSSAFLLPYSLFIRNSNILQS